jgi:hypothetical protein
MTIVYCIGIFVASWVLQLGGIRSVRGDLENGAITPWLIAAMITPALGVLVLMAFYTPGTPLARRQSERQWRKHCDVWKVPTLALCPSVFLSVRTVHQSANLFLLLWRPL